VAVVEFFILFRSSGHADRGQIDSRARPLGPHHRCDRQGGIPVGAQLVAVEDDE
jgi:hypothetical protein